MESIVTRGARVLNVGMSVDGANEIARRARGSARIAVACCAAVRDFVFSGRCHIDHRKIAITR